MKEFIYLKNNDLKKIREELFEKNNKKCKITNIEDDLKNFALDHIHGRHKSIYKTNKLIRNLIHRDVNVLIGKIENQYLRSSKKLKEIVH